MATKVAGELYESITGQLFEIGRQLRQPNGYPFDPEDLKDHLQAAVEGRFRGTERRPRGIWKTINLGTGLKTADDFRRALKLNGFKISDWANDLLGKPAFTAATEEKEIDLVKVTVAELGFKDGAQGDKIYQRAKELGLEICPAEVGPQLRLQYQDQPNGEWLLIGMEPLAESGGYLKVFCVGRSDSGLWLSSRYGGPGHFWDPDYQWVFFGSRK